MDASHRTNAKAKLLDLWGLLFFVKKRQILGLIVMGVSKVVVDWAMEAHTIQSMDLYHWIGRVMRLLVLFNNISFLHLYKEFNMMVDSLSE